jgi:hypothetical protein
MRMSIGLIVLTCMSAFAGEVSPASIEVLPDGEQCIIDAYKKQMRCDLMGGYLRDTLKIDLSRSFCVYVDGLEKVDPRAQRVSDFLQAAGYSRAHVCLSKRCHGEQPCELTDRSNE